MTATSTLASGEAGASRRRRRQPFRDTWQRGLAWGPKAWWIEISTILFGYALYEVVQGAAPVHRLPAFAHSHQLTRSEIWSHLDVELPVDHLVNRIPALASATGYYYDSLHFLITPTVLFWLWRWRPSSYGRWRSALILSSMASLVVFWAWAVAPPRLAEPGIIDTLVARHIYGTVESKGASALVNDYAAMPSLHVGWAVWCAAALVATTTVWWRHLAWLYPVATTFVVIGTGNHYLLDAAGGVVVVLFGMLLTAPASGGSLGSLRRNRIDAQPASTSAPTGISAR